MFKRATLLFRRIATLIALCACLPLSAEELTFPEAPSDASTMTSEENLLRYSVINTAQSSTTLEVLVVDGGGWFTPRNLVHPAVLIQHPKGDLLWDTGIRSNIDEQFSNFSFLEKQLFKIENVRPAISQLADQSYDLSRLIAVIPSHMHWDHVSALEDFNGTPVWVQSKEYEAALNGPSPAYIQSQFDDPNINWQTLRLEPSPYMGFSHSKDIFEDGTVVLVGLSGHTQGQVGMFLNTANQSLFFIGDTSWTARGIETLRGRPDLVNYLVNVDADAAENFARIVEIHAAQEQNPELVVVPAHDELVLNELPIYPAFSSGND